MFSLRWKIGGILVLSNLILGLILILIINPAVSDTVKKEVIERGRTVASDLASFTSALILSEDIVGLKQIISSSQQYESVEYIIIQDSENEVLVKSFNASVPKEVEEILSQTENKENLVSFTGENGYVTCFDIVQSVEDGDLGFIRVGMKKDYIDSAVNEINFLIISIIGGITLLGILVVLILANRIISPIIYLTGRADDISQGKLDERVVVNTNDEIQNLGQALERLRESVVIALDRLKKRR